MGEWHARFGGSGADRWMGCPGSTTRQEALPEDERFQSNVAAQEGTVAHHILELCLNEELDSAKKYRHRYVCPDTLKVVKTMPRGYIMVTDDMVDAVDMTLMHIDYLVDKLGASYEDIHVERQIRLTDEIGGTPDVIIMCPLGLSMVVLDFKYGFKAVEVEENKQAMFYGGCAVKELDVVPDEVVLVIAQPRASHPDGKIRSWTTTGERLESFMADVYKAVEKSKAPSAPRIAGDKQCFYCDALPKCPEAYEFACKKAEGEFAGLFEEDAKGLDLGEAYSKIKYLKRWCERVEELVHNKLNADRRSVPGYKLVEGKPGARKWNDLDAVVKHLRKQGVPDSDFLTTPALKTPPQLEKAGVDLAKVAKFIHRKQNKASVVPESSKRKELEPDFPDELFVDDELDW